MQHLFAFISILRWQDIIDVTINSYILFRLYVLFRGTNTLRVMVGLAALWFFQRAALILGLIVTSWVMQGVTAAAAIIIIVIFRNEIRTVFQAKNLRAILWDVPRKRGEVPINDLSDAITALAETRTGALLVFPGKEDLSEQIHGGIPWQGLVSKEMILSIFYHNNPVHDGAAVIEDERVSKVGCILPLSHSKDLPPNYGTRHRAAIGLAETTDALSIVVSEEHGSILAVKGEQVEQIRQSQDLHRIIHKHTGNGKTTDRRSKREKLQLSFAAIASFVFVTGIWISFTRSLDTLITLEAPIQYVNRNPDMDIIDASSDRVRLHLNGSDALIKSIRAEQVTVKLDLSKAVLGKNQFEITQNDITVPPGIVLNWIDPPQVELTLDSSIYKKLPVQVDWTGKLSEDLILSDVVIVPETIQVTGRSHFLKNISTLYTEKVSLDTITKSGTITVKPILESNLKLSPGEEETVSITYKVSDRGL